MGNILVGQFCGSQLLMLRYLGDILFYDFNQKIVWVTMCGSHLGQIIWVTLHGSYLIGPIRYVDQWVTFWVMYGVWVM